jgi:hypothetical protein
MVHGKFEKERIENKKNTPSKRAREGGEKDRERWSNHRKTVARGIQDRAVPAAIARCPRGSRVRGLSTTLRSANLATRIPCAGAFPSLFHKVIISTHSKILVCYRD